MYSKTCHQGPPVLTQKSGLPRQVVPEPRYIRITELVHPNRGLRREAVPKLGIYNFYLFRSELSPPIIHLRLFTNSDDVIVLPVDHLTGNDLNTESLVHPRETWLHLEKTKKKR